MVATIDKGFDPGGRNKILALIDGNWSLPAGILATPRANHIQPVFRNSEYRVILYAKGDLHGATTGQVFQQNRFSTSPKIVVEDSDATLQLWFRHQETFAEVSVQEIATWFGVSRSTLYRDGLT